MSAARAFPLSPVQRGVWAPTTLYNLGELAISPTGDLITPKVTFTSAAAYSAANWNILVPAPAPRWHVFLSGMATPIATVGTWAKNFDNAAWFGGFQYNTSAAQNDAVTFIADLSAGTWTLDFFSKQNTGYAIATIEFSVDGTTYTAIGTKDLYNAATAAATATFTGIVIPTTGPVRIRLRAATRNASATSWFLPVSALEWTRTA